MIASKSFVVGRVKSADPSKGIHVPTYREKKEAAKQAELDKGRNERIKILEVNIVIKSGSKYNYREIMSENSTLFKKFISCT